MPRRALEESGKRKGELNNPHKVMVNRRSTCGTREMEDCTCNELPVWNAHQTNTAEKDTASLCNMGLSDREKQKEDGQERHTSIQS